MEESFQGNCIGHAFYKAWDNRRKNLQNLRYVSIKSAQFDLQKCIIWPIFLKKKGNMNGISFALILDFA
jgi:hypothetical protein